MRKQKKATQVRSCSATLTAFSVVLRRRLRRRNPKSHHLSGHPHLMEKKKPLSPISLSSVGSQPSDPPDIIPPLNLVAEGEAKFPTQNPIPEKPKAIVSPKLLIDEVSMELDPPLLQEDSKFDSIEALVPVTVDPSTTPEQPVTDSETLEEADAPSETTISVKAAVTVTPGKVEEKQSSPTEKWTGLFKGPVKTLQRKGQAFELPSGEACVRIPNSVIEKNKKAWECFILGQFYHEPPSQGTIHNIVNGIWSKKIQRHQRFKDGRQLISFPHPTRCDEKKSGKPKTLTDRGTNNVCS